MYEHVYIKFYVSCQSRYESVYVSMEQQSQFVFKNTRLVQLLCAGVCDDTHTRLLAKVTRPSECSGAGVCLQTSLLCGTSSRSGAIWAKM